MDSIKSEEASSPQEKSLLVPSAHQILPHRPRPQTVTTSRMQPASTPLLRAAAICFSFFLVELLAGWWCGSLAILSDAAHMFTDVIGYAVAIVAVEIGSWPATQSACLHTALACSIWTSLCSPVAHTAALFV
ncbi:hypothetical protein BC830DRAFT_1137710 [Chytriomyces sp. MP71]|nr:hypothetical protein BC830DRAFT_1137710 [Chytriomyces sp. MP71]